MDIKQIKYNKYGITVWTKEMISVRMQRTPIRMQKMTIGALCWTIRMQLTPLRMLLAKVMHQVPMMDISTEAVITLVGPGFFFGLREHLMRRQRAFVADFQMCQEGPLVSKGFGAMSTENPPLQMPLGVLIHLAFTDKTFATNSTQILTAPSSCDL